MSDVLIRSTELRADAETGTVEGVAVPWNTPISVGGIREQFARGAIVDVSNTKLYWQHGEIIGRVISGEDREDGYHIKAQISDTTLGRDARTLIKDGAVNAFSVGFVPVEDREENDGTITRTKVTLREVSAVSFPAYADARITNVRESDDTANTPDALERSNDTVTDTITTTDLAEVRDSVEELTRRFDTLTVQHDDEPIADTRSAGEVLKAIVRGDEETIRQYDDLKTRAYTGGTSADSVLLPAWQGDLTRIIADSSPLPALFSTGALPATGNTLEYGQLLSNSVAVGEQVAEGDDLSFGKVQIQTKNASVKTYGGYTQLTRQEIERSSVNVLDHSLNALALAAAKTRNTALRSFVATTVAAQVTAGATVAVASATSYVDWVGAIVDAAELYEDLALPLQAMLVDKSVFKELAALTATDGRPLMSVYGSGSNVVGEINAPAISGNLAGVTVVCDPKQAAAGAAFINASAIRAYNGPIVSLTDQNVVNLSNAYSVYFYAALAAEIPAAIVPVAFGA